MNDGIRKNRVIGKKGREISRKSRLKNCIEVGLHILFVNDQINFGGVPRMIQSMCFALDKRGVQTSVLNYYKTSSRPIALPESTKLYNLNAQNRFDVFSFIRLLKILKSINADLVHDNFGGFWSFFLNIRRKLPTILHYHNEFMTIAESPDKDRSFRDQIFIWYLLPRYDAIVSVSEHNSHQLEKLNLVDYKNLVIHNFVRVNRKKTLNPNSKKTIGFLGRVVFEKGADTFVELFKNFSANSQIKGRVIGDGDPEFMLRLQSNVSENNLPIEFTGYVEDVYSELEKIDILVFLSRQEPFGLVLLEAINFGVPVVGVYPENGGGPWEILPNQDNGLISDRNVEHLAKQIEELISSYQKREDLLNRQKIMISRFSEDETINKWLDLYSSLIQQK